LKPRAAQQHGQQMQRRMQNTQDRRLRATSTISTMIAILTHLRTVGSLKWLTARSMKLPLVVLPLGVLVLPLLELGVAVGLPASTSVVAGLLLLPLLGLAVGLGVVLGASTSVVAGLLLPCSSARCRLRRSAGPDSTAAAAAAAAPECAASWALRSKARL
jgi:hypothetical protein